MKKPAILFIGAALLGGLAVWYFTRDARHPEQVAPVSVATARKAARHPEAPEKPSDRPASSDKPAVKSVELEKPKANPQLKVEDVGRQAGMMMADRKDLKALKAIPEGERTPEQSARLLQLEQESAKAFEMLRDIGSFENKSEAYTQLYGSMLKQAGSLDASQTAAVTSFMRNRARALIELNDANVPRDLAKAYEWESKRNDFNDEVVSGVAELLPQWQAGKIGFTPDFLEVMEQDFQQDSK